MKSQTRHVTIQRRLNNGDKSYTYYIVWRRPTNRGCRRVGRTGPKPKRKELALWLTRARELAYRKDIEISGRYTPEGKTNLTVSLNDAIDRYLQWIEGDDLHNRQNSPTTCIRKERNMRRFVDYVGRIVPGTRRVSQLSSQHVNGTGKEGILGWRFAREKEGWRASSIAVEISDLSAWLTWCFEQGYLPARIVLRRPDVPPPTALVPSTEQVWAAISAQPTPYRAAAIRTLACLGLRQGELKALDWSDLKEGILHIRPVGNDSNKRHERYLPLGPGLRKALEATFNSDGPIFRLDGERLHWQLNRWLKGRMRPHDLRRWFNSELERLHCPSYVIDDLMGHARSRVRAAYAGPLRTEEAADWLAKIDDVVANGKGV